MEQDQLKMLTSEIITLVNETRKSNKLQEEILHELKYLNQPMRNQEANQHVIDQEEKDAEEAERRRKETPADIEQRFNSLREQGLI